MSTIMTVCILCAVPGILAGIWQSFLLKRHGRAYSIFKTVVCYIAFFYSVLSTVKMILDGGELVLSDCFHDMVPITYLHYLIPLGLLAAVTPPLIAFLFRKADLPRQIALFDSCMFLLLALEFLFANRIGNTRYVVTMLVCALAALCITQFYHGEIIFCSPQNIKRRLWYTVPVTLFYSVTVNLSLPGALFLNNRREITIYPASFAKALLIGALVHFLIIAGIGTLLLTWRQLELFYTILFAVTLTGYIQDMILNKGLLAMDGGRQEWSGTQLWLNTAIWLVLVIGILLLKAFLHKHIAKIYRMLCVYLSLVQLVSLGYLTVSSLFLKKDEDVYTDWILSTTGALELHPDNNVLVFVLDWYDEQIMQRMLEINPDFLSPLDGFTYYTNATSMYAFTEISLPYLLSGVEWQFNMGETEYINYAYANGTMLDTISSAGYTIDLYTHKKYINGADTSRLRNYIPYRQNCHLWDTVNLMNKCAKYQMAPYAYKYIYWYTTDALESLSSDEDFTTWLTSDDIPFYAALTETGLHVDKTTNSSGNFKLYHMYGAHPPYRMTKNFLYAEDLRDYASMMSQAEGCMKIIYEYISQLKALGLYDSATIIITADHGENYLFDPLRADILKDLQMQNTTNPILLFKPSGQSGDKPCENNAPVSHAELIASIMEAINPQAAASYGRTLAEVPETEDRVRTFIFTRSDLPYVRAEIHGNVLNPESWTVVEEIKPEDK